MKDYFTYNKQQYVFTKDYVFRSETPLGMFGKDLLRYLKKSQMCMMYGEVYMGTRVYRKW